MIARRTFLKGAACSTFAALPGLSLAAAATDARFVLVILRGALDGLAAVPPYGDGQYAKQRGELALPGPGQPDGLLQLDGLFGLHPSLAGVHAAYRDGEALVLHAIASPYRDRSHFDGQDVLENGSNGSPLRDGWLNRALAGLPGRDAASAAIALAQTPPLVLRGDRAVTSWAPSSLPDADEATLARLADLYADDEFFASRLAQALRSQAIAEGMGDAGERRRRGNEAAQLEATMRAAGRFLAADDGARIAVVESGGWDTHANQGATDGALANRLAALDRGLAALRGELGDAWRQSVIAVVTEFGRTVRPNGTRGTDHGTATAALLLGGAVAGGRVLADWPGLANRDLHEGRDLRPTADLRGLFKGVLAGHLALPEALLERAVFPGSAAVKPAAGLLRA